MKVRLGFVSNSSSSSYIIGTKKEGLRETLLNILQIHHGEIKDLLESPYDTIEKVVDKLILLFESVDEPWLEERKNWHWIKKMRDTFSGSIERDLIPYYIKLDIVLETKLEMIVHHLTSLSEDEIYIQQIKYP